MKRAAMALGLTAGLVVFQGCNEVKYLNGTLTQNTGQPVVVTDDPSGKPVDLVPGTAEIELEKGLIRITTGSRSATINVPKEYLKKKDLTNLDIPQTVTGDGYELKFEELQPTPITDSYERTESCTVSVYRDIPDPFCASGWAHERAWRWGHRTVRYSTDTVFRNFKADFLVDGKSLATFTARKEKKSRYASVGYCQVDPFAPITGTHSFCVARQVIHHPPVVRPVPAPRPAPGPGHVPGRPNPPARPVGPTPAPGPGHVPGRPNPPARPVPRDDSHNHDLEHEEGRFRGGRPVERNVRPQP